MGAAVTPGTFLSPCAEGVVIVTQPLSPASSTNVPAIRFMS
jgi:hypothetical protein